MARRYRLINGIRTPVQPRPSIEVANVPFPCRLRPPEKNYTSRDGEDGVLEWLFGLIGTTDKFFVEIGAGSTGAECVTQHLRQHCGWNGLQIDGNGSAPVVRAFVTAENVNAVLAANRAPEAFDLLAIDIDGNDYWIWKAIDRRPRAICIEYNSHLGPHVEKVIDYKPDWRWNGLDDYYSATILSMSRLAWSKGYRLVYCDSRGVNAYFVRLEDAEAIPRKSVEELYRPPRFNTDTGLGHSIRRM